MKYANVSSWKRLDLNYAHVSLDDPSATIGTIQRTLMKVPRNDYSMVCLVFVAILWGVSNPLIRRGSEGLERIKVSSRHEQYAKEFLFLLTNAKYMVPFLISQIGSAAYFLILQNIDISLAVPISNSLTFVVTAITGQVLGEEKVHKYAYLGMILVLLGVTICCWDRLN